jgi:hypothetical protein
VRNGFRVPRNTKENIHLLTNDSHGQQARDSAESHVEKRLSIGLVKPANVVPLHPPKAHSRTQAHNTSIQRRANMKTQCTGRTFTAARTGNERTMPGRTPKEKMSGPTWWSISRRLLEYSSRVGVAKPFVIPTAGTDAQKVVTASVLPRLRHKPSDYSPYRILPEGMIGIRRPEVKATARIKRRQKSWGTEADPVVLKNSRLMDFKLYRKKPEVFVSDLALDAARVVPFDKFRKNLRRSALNVYKLGNTLPKFGSSKSHLVGVAASRRQLMDKGFRLINLIYGRYGRKIRRPLSKLQPSKPRK